MRTLAALGVSLTLCAFLAAQTQPPDLNSWNGSWSPYRLIDDAGKERRLIKATVDVPASTATVWSVELTDVRGQLLDAAPVPAGKARQWAHGYWVSGTAASGNNFTVRLRQGEQTLSSRTVAISGRVADAASVPLRLDRLNRGLLARLNQREASAVAGHGADVLAYLRQHDIIYKSPAPSWVEGLPLGNGDFGALVSGAAGAEQVIHLDKSDIWYTAPDGTALGRSYAGTLRVKYGDGGTPGPFSQKLSLGRAEVTTSDGGFRSSLRVHALKNRFEAEIRANEVEINVQRDPATLYLDRRTGYVNASRLFGSWNTGLAPAMLKLLREESANSPHTKVEWQHDASSCWFTHTAPNMSYAVSVSLLNSDVQWLDTEKGCAARLKARGTGPIRVHVTIATSLESGNPVERARQLLADQEGDTHRRWWADFWKRSWIEIPDKLEENLWYMGLYQQAACSRSDQAISFFGLWHPLDYRTWYDAYVSDAQTPMIWWLCFSSNHLELLYPSHRTFARLAPEFVRHTATEGMIVPHFFFPEWAGGRAYYTGSNTHKGSTAWFTMNFWWDYLYSGDREFLREVTYPLLRMSADFFTGYLKKEADGRYHLYQSNSPEQDGTSTDNTFDWALTQFLYRAALEASEVLGVDAQLRPAWRDRIENLYRLPTDGKTIWESATVAHPYRCHPVVMFTLHPSNTISYGSAEFESMRRTIEAVTRLIGYRYEDRHAAIPGFEGGVEPNGFSSGMLTTSAARLGDRQMYQRLLYGLILRFHLKQNGLRALLDTRQSDDISRSSLVEAANAHTVAITETLVQSWRDHVRVFPCIGREGRYRFSGLRAAGGFILSGEAEGGQYRWVQVKSLLGGKLKLVLPGAAGPVTREVSCQAGRVCTVAAQPDILPTTALDASQERNEPRRVAIAAVETMVEPLVYYPENLPFGQVVEDDSLYLGRPAKFGPPPQPPTVAELAGLAASPRWQERQRAARLLAIATPPPEATSALDRLSADSMNIVAHTAAVSLVHLGTPEALALAQKHAQQDSVPGLKREVEKARKRLAPAAVDQWQSLFDGKSLQGWRETAFKGRGNVRVEKGAIVLDAGSPMTGITWAGSFPRTGYEVRFEGARLKGGDFFASLTFPVGDSHCTWVTGGWGGDIVGLSSLDGWDASDNETRTYFNFETGRWYAFRLRVTDDRITAWIDDRQIINVAITGRSVELRFGEIKLSAPFGFASYATAGGLRKIDYRLLRPAAGDQKAKPVP